MATQTLNKQPSESRVYAMDFSAKMDATDSVASVSSITVLPATLTYTTPTPSGKSVVMRLSGGVDNTQYKVTVIIVTTLGNTLEGEGFLLVKDI